AVAAAWPGPGLWLRDLACGGVSLPVVLLAVLLFNAGLGVRSSQLRQLARAPLVLLGGLAANLAVPLLFLFVLAPVLRLWHTPDEVQSVVVGLALVGAMPVAGSSTAWSQNANGNVAVSLGLVLLSTLASPLTTPVALRSVGWLATGEYAEGLRRLA